MMAEKVTPKILFALSAPNGAKMDVTEQHEMLVKELKAIVGNARKGEDTTLDKLVFPVLGMIAQSAGCEIGDMVITSGVWQHGDNVETLPAGFSLAKWAKVSPAALSDVQAKRAMEVMEKALKAVQVYNNLMTGKQYSPLSKALGLTPADPFKALVYPSKVGRKAGSEPAAPKEKKIDLPAWVVEPAA